MFSIGDLSRRTGVKVTTIRYYESRGLLAHAGRTAGNQRRYDDAGLRRLEFIRHARELGLGLEATGALIALSDRPGGVCADSHAIVAAHLADLRARIARLRALERELQRIAQSCNGEGQGDCSLILTLGDHGQCAGAHG